MSYIKICAFSIIFSSLLLLISGREKELSSAISSAIFITVVLFVITRAAEMVKSIVWVLESIDVIESEIIIKICGICILSFVSCSICESAGQKGIASSIEMLSAVEILIIFYPTVKKLTDNILGLLNG